MTRQEQKIYDCAGGGEAGEKAVKERRRYFDSHESFCKSLYKNVYQNKFTHHNEKPTATLSIEEDNYN